jgi:hypothetical protein
MIDGLKENGMGNERWLAVEGLTSMNQDARQAVRERE